MPKVSPEYLAARGQQILDAAIVCFDRSGFHRTSMQDIFDEAGLSTGAVYRYFDSKEAIIEAIAEQRHAREAELITEAMAVADPREALHRLADLYFGWLRDPEEQRRRRIGVLVWAEAINHTGLRSVVQRGADQRRLLTGFPQLAKEVGALTPEADPEAITRVYLEPPAVLLRRQLAWAIVHGMSERVHLLADHGVDLVTPYERHAWHAAGTPAELAATAGHPELVEYLVNCGAPRPDLAPNDAFIAAVLANDQASIEQLRLDHPDLPERVRASRPGLTVWAAANGHPGAVELLVDLGFDVNAKGRSDVPANQPWHTALHAAVEHGDLELAQTLLRLGADPTVTDQRFDATPLEWARHAGSQPLVDLLEPLTPPPPVGDGVSTSEPAR